MKTILFAALLAWAGHAQAFDSIDRLYEPNVFQAEYDLHGGIKDFRISSAVLKMEPTKILFSEERNCSEDCWTRRKVLEQIEVVQLVVTYDDPTWEWHPESDTQGYLTFNLRVNEVSPVLIEALKEYRARTFDWGGKHHKKRLDAARREFDILKERYLKDVKVVDYLKSRFCDFDELGCVEDIVYKWVKTPHQRVRLEGKRN